MGLIRLTYTSVAVAGFGNDDLREILAKSQRNNRRDGVTGFLTYSAPCFVQSLEGKREAVTAVYERIRTDPRHTTLRTLVCRDIDAREFAEWAMELIHLDAETLAAIAPVWEPRRGGEPRQDSAVEERLVRLVRGAHPAAAGATPPARRVSAVTSSTAARTT